jgi:hypothetical protein
MLFVFNLLLQLLGSRLASSSGGSSRLERISVAELFVESLGAVFIGCRISRSRLVLYAPLAEKGADFLQGRPAASGWLEPIKTGRISCSDTRTNP